MPTLTRICVFCGSRPGERPEYVTAARALGVAMAERGVGLVYGGGNIGLMGAIADAILDAGGTAIGVMPQRLVDREIAHTRLTELHVVSTMHERKALMERLSDAFIAMPGGFGTFEELFEVITWLQLGIHQKPAGLLNVAGYYEPLFTLIRNGVREGFIPESHAATVFASADPAQLVEALEHAHLPQPAPKWITREET